MGPFGFRAPGPGRLASHPVTSSTRSQNHRSHRLLKPFPAWKQIAVFPGTLIRAVSTGGQIAVFFQICREGGGSSSLPQALHLEPVLSPLPRSPQLDPSLPMASDLPDAAMAEPVAATKSSSSFVIAALKREMEAENASGAEGTAIHRLALALQAALIDAGFLAANPPGSRLGLLKNSVSGASSTLTAKYTLPEFVAMLPEAEQGKIVVLNYSLMPNFVTIYACVPGSQSQVLRLCLELPKLAPLLYLDSSNAVGAVEEKEVLQLWRVLKDELCLPLMISLCQLNGLSLPPCLMALPDELKDKVLELLPGVDLAKVQCTCKELKDLAADNDLWERKFVMELNTLGDGSRWGRNWKKWFEVAWTRKAANSTRQRKRPRPSFTDYGWDSSPPSPRTNLFPVIHDDFDYPDCSGLYMDYGWGNSPPSLPNFLTIEDEMDRLPYTTYWA
ncbi:hypothetical protein QYE76_069624 [Lolium multiflorum]|uniref:F-box domain-containing protein n=1 Tax=Lolium multiflorum TaxID=4521 RepID=A0AAD8SHN2_LOLMU|nr:hypothetical protein QYE76_069624 [Lolium multiflorum]